MATLSGSHVIAGAAAAMSSLGSAMAIAMMVGRPPWPRGLVQTGSVHRVGHRLVRLETTFHAERTAAPELKHGLMTRAQSAAVS